MDGKDQLSHEKNCIKCCCEEADISFRICRQISKSEKSTLSFWSSTNLKRYDSFAEIKSSSPNISWKVWKPDFVNPSSRYKDIIFVIQSIGQRAGVKQYGEERNGMAVR